MKFMRESSHAENEIPSNSRQTKRTLQPTEILRKKKSAQTNAPLIIPSVTLEAYHNQATQPQPPSQAKFNRPQPTKPQSRLKLRSQSQLSQPRPQPQLCLQPQLNRQHTPPPSRPLPQPNGSQTILTQVLRLQEFSMVNRTPSSSSSHVSEESNGNKISILPEGDGFDQHELVVKQIASIIRTNLKEGKPSWKQLSKEQRDSWFDIFKSKFTWPPQHEDMVRRNFEKRGSAKMIQLMQEARKRLDEKPIWMEECVWAQLKAHWESLKYKRMSETNKRNCESMVGASLHTGGSIPHRLHWKRMKEAKGTDPSLAEFYFRTHRKKNQSWVGPCAESAYDKFEQRKLESSSKFVSEENGGDNQRSREIPSDLDIWVDSVGKKKGRVFGLGSLSKTLVTSVKLPTNTKDVNVLRNQIHALNESLHKQEQEKIEMKKELTETRKQVMALMQHLGFAGSSS
ncbi:uncharacterized protein LOC131616488 isoform X2 [Vicia villosa]|nr:uncharacterized protein LOC131616488 isoform X2 [Vicia villosa]